MDCTYSGNNITMGAIHSTKLSGNFGPKLNGLVRSNRKSFEKTGPPFEVVLFSRSDRLEFWLNGSRPILLHIIQQFTFNSEIIETISSMVVKSQVTTLNFIYNCQNLRQQQEKILLVSISKRACFYRNSLFMIRRTNNVLTITHISF